MTETTISIRPILITYQVFTDGVEVFETTSQSRAWGVFISGPDTKSSCIAANRQAAIDVATEVSMALGWQIAHIAPEPEAGETPKGETLQ